MPIKRARPLVLVATPDADLAERLVDDVRRTGSVACLARSAAGCLRVATSVGPDIVLLDARLPDRLPRMLRAHPATAASTIVPVADGEATWTECVGAVPPAYHPAELFTLPDASASSGPRFAARVGCATRHFGDASLNSCTGSTKHLLI